MGNGGSATAHQLPAVQRGTHREARAEALGHRRFPANIADVGGSGEDVIRGRPWRHLINQQGVAVTTSERFAFLATGAGNIVQAVVNIVGAESGADRRGKSAFLVAPCGVP